jgi:membrane protein
MSSIAAGTGHLLTGLGSQVLAIAISLVLNVAVFWLAFRLATAFQVSWRHLRYGAAIAAIVWQVLQVAGGYVVGHQLQRASALYGIFGVVLGLMAWLFVQAEATLFAAEVDAVLARRLWPRALQSDSQEEEGRDEKEARQNEPRAA